MGAKNDINNLHINVSAFDKWDSLCVLCSSVRPGRRRFCGVVQRNETFADWNLIYVLPILSPILGIEGMFLWHQEVRFVAASKTEGVGPPLYHY